MKYPLISSLPQPIKTLAEEEYNRFILKSNGKSKRISNPTTGNFNSRTSDRGERFWRYVNDGAYSLLNIESELYIKSASIELDKLIAATKQYYGTKP